MDNIAMIIFLLVSIWLGKFTVDMQGCPIPTPISCSFTNATTRTIYVNGSVPTGQCVVVKYDTSYVIYDPVMISTVWVAFVNADNVCPATMATKATSVSTALAIPTTQEVIILNITPLYFQMILLSNRSFSPCTAYPFLASQISEAQLMTSQLTLAPIYYDLNTINPYCLNGGILNTSYMGAGYNCTCTPGVTSYSGPNCQYMERSINTKQIYTGVFRNATRISMRFSFFSNGITGSQTLLTIKGPSYTKMVEIAIVESTVTMTTNNLNTVIISQPVDKQTWSDFNLVVSATSATLTLNSTSRISNFSNPIGDFRGFYLILNENATNANQMCIKNLIINSRIIDLNGPNYTSCCTNRCKYCPSPQLCNCHPFESSSSTQCYCPLGSTQNGSSCIQSDTSQSQVPMSTESLLQLSSSVSLSRLDFNFQTRGTNGTLLTVILVAPPTIIYIKIANSNLTLNVLTGPVRTLNYNVSNGLLHSVTLLITPYSLTMNLDNNANFTSFILNWYIPTPALPITGTTILLGPLKVPYNGSINTYTTCFSPIQLNIVSGSSILNSSSGTNVQQTCTSGPRCNTTQCTSELVCDDTQWQNTRCMNPCPTNYTNSSSVCIYNGCINIPCKNSGTCYFNSSTGSYSCNCAANWTGFNCETGITVASLWWIAVIVVLFLLLVILIALLVYCCCFAGRRPANETIITKINENIVVYNDQAGESDYTGPPINFAIMKNALNNGTKTQVDGVILPAAELMAKKEEFDKYNVDLILDHPLEYGFEGFESENESISSIGSSSNESEVNFSEMPNINIKFD